MLFFFFSKLILAKEPNIFAEWPNPPKISICDEHINKEMVLNSVKYWEEKGHHIQKVYIRKNCAYEEGSIYIRLSQEDVGDFQWANTYSKWNTSTRIYKRAIINFSEDALNMQDVYTHELGHAFGYIHTKDRNHIMHGSQGPFDNLSYRPPNTN